MSMGGTDGGDTEDDREMGMPAAMTNPEDSARRHFSRAVATAAAYRKL